MNTDQTDSARNGLDVIEIVSGSNSTIRYKQQNSIYIFEPNYAKN